MQEPHDPTKAATAGQRPRRKYQTAEHTQRIAMSPPAVRMLVVCASVPESDDGELQEPFHWTYPVLALSARVAHAWSAPGNTGRPESPSATTMRGNGWAFEGSEVKYDCLIMDECYGLVETEVAFQGTIKFAYRVVPCPWPPSKDAARLAETIREVKAEAVRAATRQRRKDGDA